VSGEGPEAGAPEVGAREAPEAETAREEPPPPATDLERRLREAGAEELLALARERGAEISPAGLRQALRNLYLDAEVVAVLASQERLLAYYEVRRDLVRCRCTPEALAMRLIPGLYWADLMAIGLDTRLHPRLRRAADQYLMGRLPGLSIGEKVSIARRGGPAILVHLRHDPTPRVVAALLDNPRLTEGTLAPVVHGERTPPQVLELIAADRRWGARYSLRLALARNAATPLGVALRLLAGLHKPDLRGLAADSRLAEPLRRRARLLLGDLAGEGV
jgi:hypothetical protein